MLRGCTGFAESRVSMVFGSTGTTLGDLEEIMSC